MWQAACSNRPMDFLAWIEASAFSAWVRESPSIWAYPTFLFLHTAGLAFAMGMNVALDLRLVGASPNLPIAPMARFYPLMWWGFWINAVSGVVLLMADATTKATNWMFFLKMGIIFLAVWNSRIKQTRLFGDPAIDSNPLAPNLAHLGWASLVLWMAAVTTGRLMAYVGPVSGLNLK